MTIARIAMHSTRLFPKNHGAAAYRLTGLAARCDWVIMADQAKGDFYVHGDLNRSPRTVFLSMRGFFGSIPYFHDEILPKITGRFVLISGSEDLTIPNQVDQRWRPFGSEEKGIIQRILSDKRLIHWFAENRDSILPRMSSLPVGYVFPNEPSELVELNILPNIPVIDRHLRVLCAHRIRTGPQWEPRRRVSRLAAEVSNKLVTVAAREITEDEYIRLVKEHAFVLCVQGGGVDPSPKAWMAIANGSIPIIESSPLDDAYCHLPVAFVDKWDDECLSEKRLSEWMERLSPYYDNVQMRLEVLERLKLDYWWKQITDKIRAGPPG